VLAQAQALVVVLLMGRRITTSHRGSTSTYGEAAICAFLYIHAHTYIYIYTCSPLLPPPHHRRRPRLTRTWRDVARLALVAYDKNRLQDAVQDMASTATAAAAAAASSSGRRAGTGAGRAIRLHNEDKVGNFLEHITREAHAARKNYSAGRCVCVHVCMCV